MTALDRVLDLVDQPALDALGELDLADAAATARRARASLPSGTLRYFRLSLVVAPFGVSSSFSSSFSSDRARLAHGVDLLQHLLRALVDAARR